MRGSIWQTNNAKFETGEKACYYNENWTVQTFANWLALPSTFGRGIRFRELYRICNPPPPRGNFQPVIFTWQLKHSWAWQEKYSEFYNLSSWLTSSFSTLQRISSNTCFSFSRRTCFIGGLVCCMQWWINMWFYVNLVYQSVCFSEIPDRIMIKLK